MQTDLAHLIVNIKTIFLLHLPFLYPHKKIEFYLFYLFNFSTKDLDVLPQTRGGLFSVIKYNSEHIHTSTVPWRLLQIFNVSTQP